MTTHARRLLAALIVVLCAATVLAACGGDDGSNADPTTSATSQESSETTDPANPPEPQSFDEVPGKALGYQRYGNKFTVELKPILIQWNSQFADKPADPGSKFLTVFAALRPKLADRGVTDLRFDEVWVRFEPVAGGCVSPVHIENVEYCFVQNTTTWQPIELDEPDWRTETWRSLDIMGVDLDAGVDYRVPLNFSITDGTEAKNGFQLCGNADGTFSPDRSKAPCVPIPQS
jgi:hypothetical protein